MKKSISTYLLVGLVLASCHSQQQKTETPLLTNDSTSLSSLIDSTLMKPQKGTNEINLNEGNFAIVSRTNGEKPEWSSSSINGSSGGGEGVFFFEKNGDFYGNIIGFDYDSYWLNGTYKIVEKSDTTVLISLTGKSIVNIEGRGVVESKQLSKSELSLIFNGLEAQGKSEIFFANRIGSSLFVFQALSPTELFKAKELFIKGFAMIEEQEKVYLNSKDSIKQ